MCLCECCIHISVVFLWMYLNNVCASVSGLMCAQVCMRICRFEADASQCVKCCGLNPSSESNKGGRPLESNRHSFWPRRGSNIFSPSVGGKKPVAEKTTTNDQLHLLFFLPSLSLSISSSLTLSDLIPTLYICTVPVQLKASLEMLH